ncbi:MAG: 4-hydroxy-tetrahydrodipicolinate reductase [Lachnospiraceae bacterium]|nr:4-hydroxy-tetrahydrodipicolinate reductase [Lachnospiraceae bacterium]
MRIILSGMGGHMGAEVLRLAKDGFRGAEVVCGVDPKGAPECGIPCVSSFDEVTAEADCIIDFSHHAGTAALTAFARAKHLPLVIATTGQTEEEKAMIREAAEEIPVFFAANFSMGIALLIELAKTVAAAMPDAEIEIVEAHHDRKIDAPSGTALAIAEAIRSVRPEATLHAGRSGQGKRTKEEIGIHAIRMGNIVGMHEVLIGTPSQTITLKHEALSRALFAEGAVAAAGYLVDREAGLYDMKSLVG